MLFRGGLGTQLRNAQQVGILGVWFGGIGVRAVLRFPPRRQDSAKWAGGEGNSFARVQQRLAELKLPTVTEEFWHTVHGNLETWYDLTALWTMCYGQITPIINDQDYINQALKTLPPTPWDATTWSTWTNRLKGDTGRKGKELFMPLRQALTAQDHGPEMKYLLPIIGLKTELLIQICLRSCSQQGFISRQVIACQPTHLSLASSCRSSSMMR